MQRALGALSAALAFGSAAAFMPSFKPELDVVKAAQKLLVPGVAVLGLNAPMVPPAHADGAVSAATGAYVCILARYALRGPGYC